MAFLLPPLVGLCASLSFQAPLAQAPPPSPSERGVVDLDFSQLKVRLRPGPPAYPPLAKLQGIQGTVIVEIILDLQGRPESAKALEGPGDLRASAEAYAMEWRFEPALQNGAPARCRFRMAMPFRLRALPKAHVTQAVVEAVARIPEAGMLLPGVREAVSDGLKRLGVREVEAREADPATAHHLQFEVGKAADAPDRLSLAVRCTRLKDLPSSNREPGKPDSVLVRVRLTPEGADPARALKELVMPLLLSILQVPEIAPRTPSAEP